MDASVFDVAMLLKLLASCVGYGALVSVVVNILKFFKVVQDDTANSWLLGFQLLGIVLLFVAQFIPGVDIPKIDLIMGGLAELLTLVLALLISIGASRFTHAMVRGMPVIGKSYSYERMRQVLG